MSPLRLDADVEALLVAYLKGHSEVKIAPIEGRVATELPAKPKFPLLRLFRVPGGRSTAIERHQDVARVQVDAWAETKSDARRAAAIALAALHQAPEAAHALGVVTAVETTIAPGWFPDPETDRPRYLFEVAVHVHPPIGG